MERFRERRDLLSGGAPVGAVNDPGARWPD